MEDIISNQYQLIKGIETVFINFKKDGAERKTCSNVQKRLSTLSTYWNEFKSNHQQLVDYQVENKYFQENVYEKTEAFYLEVSSYLAKYARYLEHPASCDLPSTPKPGAVLTFDPFPKANRSPSKLKIPTIETNAGPSSINWADASSGDDAAVAATLAPNVVSPAYQKLSNHNNINNFNKLDDLLRKQKSNFKAFSRTITNIDFDNLSEKWEFEDIIKHIENRWTAIDSLHWEIDSQQQQEDEEYERMFNRYEREYCDIKKALNKKMWSASFKTQSTPTIEIPTFHGDYHKWISFKDLFVESIHSNKAMSNAQKMQFLKGKLKGEAEKLIQHLNISTENYQVCWDILNHRYSNSKLIFSSHMNILMSLPTIQQQSAIMIKKLHDTTNECLNAIKALGVDISTWDPIVVHILSQKLDTESHKDYIESVKNPRDLPSLLEFMEFLENKFTSLEASRRKQDSQNVKSSTPSQSFGAKNVHQFRHNQNNNFNKQPVGNGNGFSRPHVPKAMVVSTSAECPQCKGTHGIFACKQFLELNGENKLKTVNKYNLCYNCLYDHRGKKCHSTKTCRSCHEPHNTLLHDAFMKSAVNHQASTISINKSSDKVNVSQNNSSEILLATALVKVQASDGTYHQLRALVDQGSQISLITENAAQALKLPRRRCKGVVFGLGARENNCKGSLDIKIISRHGDFTFNTNAVIMKDLVKNLPNQTFQKPTWKHLENITLADPEFNISRPVDLLLSAEIYSLIMMGGIIKGENESQPIAQQTHLGWLLCGNVKTYYQCNVVLNNLDDIERFWKIEDITDNESDLSTEDSYCLQQYQEQTTRQADGRLLGESEPDLLLSAEIYSLIMMGGIIKGENESQPIAQQTHLGWLLCGNVKTYYQCNVVLNNLDDIERFWKIEDITDNESDLSTEDSYCLQQYQEQTTRQADGRYVVRLPMKPGYQDKLGESKQRAVAQLFQLEKKFAKKEHIADGYKKFIHEYIDLGHMHRAINDGNSTPCVYLPHHCVIRADSTTTALRVVVNASYPTTTGYSLNDVMYSGPNLQQNLLSLILKWRRYEIAFTADIEKMFRQIIVHPDDRNLQKIIWRDSTNERLQEYNLATVTYGTRSAPFLSMRTLKQLAKDEGDKYHLSPAKHVLEDDMYMDDLLSGSYSISAAKQLQSDLIQLLKSGGFNLRKWSSNKLELLEGVETAKSTESFAFKYPESTKTLGLRWNPQSDEFSFQINIDQKSTKPVSKRILLSEISKVFDPLGWLSPVTTQLKLLFQRVWLHDMQWDSTLPEDLGSEWDQIRNQLQNIEEIKIKRWLNTRENDTIELHGFCDASLKAYGCVIYCKIQGKNQDGKQHTSINIVAAKTRLVPVKKSISLPRLELMSCLLLSKLMETVLQINSTSFLIKTYGWTDSTAALGWLQGDSNRWKTFVANRVDQIRNIMPAECWRHVRSSENPADCASRGINVNQLREHQLWWTGPSWLTTFNPEIKQAKPRYETSEELKKSVQANIVTIDKQNIISDIINKHSNFTRVTRVMAWILRAVSRVKPKQAHLSVNEITQARQKVISYVQQAVFSNEINQLRNEGKLDSKSKILSLNPFLDQDGLLRVGGRIKRANINQDMKHPIIIPNDTYLTELLINQSHRNTFHGGARLTQAHLRQRYWVLGGNRAVKKQLRKCVVCRRQKPSQQSQIMGDLPSSRINQSRPFFNTGVDFTGFVDVKANKGRGIKTTKGYISVFVCMATKAVHLELVSDLSSSAFLSALRRMAARRGAPRHIFCDNGTNFVGASRILKEEYINLQETLNMDTLAEITDMEIEFHFNAPSWPSAGGLWEAAVKSLKHHLRRIVGEQKLTFEEYSTLLSQLEACLNSRPLCALTEDPEDINYLTPAHFLASGPTLTIIETEKDQRTRWQLTQKMFSDTWKRWQGEYLCQLTARSKWQQPQQNQKVGDIVVIHDTNLPAGKWSLGRVIELHPGRDGQVRVVSLKTKNGIIQRPIVKLSTLPVNSEDGNQSKAQPEQQVESEIKTKNPRVKSVSKLSTLAITLLALLFISPIKCDYQTSQLKQNQSIYFDKISDMHLTRDYWKLIVYYDMEPYWKGSEMLETYINNLKNLCNSNKPSLCDVILIQLRHDFMELDHYNRILLGQQNDDAHLARARRGLINGVGRLTRTLFGVLDDQFAEQYEKDIELLRVNQQHLATLWKNQTSVIEAEHNLLQRVAESIDKQHKTINQHIINLEKTTNSIKGEILSMEDMNKFALSAIIANSILLNLRSIQNNLMDTLVDLYHGSFNIHLIKPEQLRDELNIISGQLSKDLSLPINNSPSDLAKLYHLITVKAKMTKQFFIFEIKFPLVARDYYEIYHLIPIQHEVRNSMISIIPIAEYVAMNIQKDSYLTLSQSDVNKCNTYDDLTYLCNLRSPVHHITSDRSLCMKNEISQDCLTNTRACKTTWVGLNELNTHLYSCCKRCNVRVICGNQVSAEQLYGSGIITISEDCIIKSETFTILSHRRQENKLSIKADALKIDIPSINHIIDIAIPIVNETLNQETEINQTAIKHQLKEIGQQIQQMKETGAEVVLSGSQSSHDFTQNLLIYGILSFLLILVLGLAWRGIKTCRTGTVHVTTAHQQQQPPSRASQPRAQRIPRATAAVSPPPPPPPPPPPALAAELNTITERAPTTTSRLANATVQQQSSTSRQMQDRDIELKNLMRARLVNKATSP